MLSAAEDGELSPVPGTHMEEEKQLFQIAFSDIHTVI